MKNFQPHITIIGAGVSGLSLGYHLKASNLDFTILEKSRHVGGSWRHMPDNMEFVSPHESNQLSGDDAVYFPFTRKTYSEYLERYQHVHEIPVETNSGVSEVAFAPDTGFQLTLADGTEKETQILVNATGYFASPHIPGVEGLEGTAIPQYNFANYGSANDVIRKHSLWSPRVLIVGQGISSGALIEEWNEAGAEIHLSLRSPLKKPAPPWTKILFYDYVELLEKGVLFMMGRDFCFHSARILNPGARELLRSQKIEIKPQILKIKEDRVQFEDDTEERYDLIHWATGFVPHLPHLSMLGDLGSISMGESSRYPNLFFLGIHCGFNFRSRFIRGIREDAPKLAKLISERVQA